MKSVQIENFPEYMVNYAYYGNDEAGELRDKEIREFEEWRKRNGYGQLLSVDGEHNFCSHPEFGLACEVVPVSFSVEENNQTKFDKSDFGLYNSRRPLKSSQKGFENVAEGTRYDDYHIDTNGMGILSVENIIEEIEGRGNQAVLTVQTSDGSTNHSQFGSKDWKEYKDSVNNAGNAITDVWVTEVEGGSYVRNSRRPIKSGWVFISSIGDANIFEENNKYLVTLEKGANTVEEYFDDEASARDFAKEITSSFIHSARYIATDPESGEVLGSADTYEEAVNEWGEDVTITDSEAVEGQGEDMGLFQSRKSIISGINDECIGTSKDGRYSVYKNNVDKVYMFTEDGYFTREVDYDDPEVEGVLENWKEIYNIPLKSSKKPETTKQFITRILSELETGEITEDEAAENQEENGLFSSWDNDTPRGEGWLAHDDGKQKNECPYERGTEEYEDWIDGWEAAYQEVNSSNQLNGDKAFLSNIVSSVLSQSMTQEQAVKRIALRNNCNQAFARNILSSAMEDTSLIQSGVMAIADDINKDFNIDGDIESWFTDYVPREGTANTVGGEILRAFAQIRGRYYNDGDRIGVGMGKENVNPAARYLIDNCVGWTEVSNIEDMLSGDSDINKDNNSYNEWLEDCEYSLEDYLRNNEDYFHAVNKDDMWNYKTEHDNYESIDEIFIVDNDNNEYWFQGGGDGWHCYTINYSHQPQYEVNSWVDDLDDIPDTSGDFCDFQLDGFEYSAEKSRNGEDWMITDVRLPNGIVQVDEEWETSDFEPYTVYDSQGREISINDLY